MFKRILIIIFCIASQNELAGKCRSDDCPNTIVFVNKNAAKNGPSVCQTQQAFAFFSLRNNDTDNSDPVPLDIGTGINPATGLCKCGHTPWIHTNDSSNFPFYRPETAQKPNEIPQCPK